MSAEQTAHRLRWVRHLAGGAVSVLCLLIFFRQIALPEVLEALANFYWPYLFLGLASLAVGYMLRIVRWSVMLRAAGAKVTFANCSAPFLGSIALNNVLPLRLGDAIRALVFPRSMGISKTTATSSLVVERLVDLMALLASLAVGIFAIRALSIPIELKTSALALAVAGGLLLGSGFFFSAALGRFFAQKAAKTQGMNASGATATSRAYEAISGLLYGFDAMSRPKLLLSILLLSMLVWVGEAGLFYFVLLGAGLDGTPLVALLVMAVATLSTLVPSSPGYVGPFHLAAFTAVSLVGGTAAQAGSYAVIVHLALWLPTTVAGAIAIWLTPGLFRAASPAAQLDAQDRKSNTNG